MSRYSWEEDYRSSSSPRPLYSASERKYPSLYASSSGAQVDIPFGRYRGQTSESEDGRKYGRPRTSKLTIDEIPGEWRKREEPRNRWQSNNYGTDSYGLHRSYNAQEKPGSGFNGYRSQKYEEKRNYNYTSSSARRTKSPDQYNTSDEEDAKPATGSYWYRRLKNYQEEKQNYNYASSSTRRTKTPDTSEDEEDEDVYRSKKYDREGKRKYNHAYSSTRRTSRTKTPDQYSTSDEEDEDVYRSKKYDREGKRKYNHAYSSTRRTSRTKTPDQYSTSDEEDVDEVGVDKMERRIVLIGKTGVGKSSTANTILGKSYFQSKVSSMSVTQKCAKKEAKRFGKKLLVVDTPGLFDTEITQEKITCEIAKCIAITAPGPHVFLIVLQVGRFTTEEKTTIDEFVKCFGKRLYDFAIVLFTRRDDIERGGESFEEYIRCTTKSLKTILRRCGKRYIAFNNDADTRTKDKDVRHLLDIVEDILEENDGSCYTNEMYEVAEKQVQERMKKIKEIERRKKEKEVEKMTDSITEKFQGQFKAVKAKNLELKSKMDEIIRERDCTVSQLKATERDNEDDLKRLMEKREKELKRQMARLNAEKEKQRLKEKELRDEKMREEKRRKKEIEERFQRETEAENLRRKTRDESEKKGFFSHAWDGLCSFGRAIASPFKAIFS